MKNKKITEATMKHNKKTEEIMQKNLRDYFSTPKSPDYEKLVDNIRDYIGELEYRPNQHLDVQKVVTRLNSILRTAKREHQ